MEWTHQQTAAPMQNERVTWCMTPTTVEDAAHCVMGNGVGGAVGAGGAGSAGTVITASAEVTACIASGDRNV